MERTNTKHCVVGDLEFDIAVNRAIVANAFEKFPKLWEVMQELDEVKDRKDFKVIQKYYEFETQKEEFVRYIFPLMLEYGKSELYENGSYENMAKEYLDYFDDQDVLNDEQDEDGEAQFGVLTLLYQFAMSVFTTSKGVKRKVTVKI